MSSITCVPPLLPEILVIDDDAAIRSMLAVVMIADGWIVHLASSGGEAIQLYQKHRPQLRAVLLDVCMPGLDGPQTIQALHDIDRTVPIAFMTGFAGGYTKEFLQNLGSVCILAKPFGNLVNLQNQLRRMADFPAGAIAA